MIEQDLFDRPRHVLGCWTRCSGDLGFLYQRFSSLLRDEACPFRNQQSRTRSNAATMFYPGLVAHSFFWLFERV